MKKNNLAKLIVTASIIAAGAGFLIYSSKANAEYYKLVDELMQEPHEWVGKTMRIHGYVVVGSIKEDIVNQKTVRTFVLENKGQSIQVKHEGPAPDTFKDQSEVVAKGILMQVDGEYVLEATELMAKCPSKYEGAPVNKRLDKNTVF